MLDLDAIKVGDILVYNNAAVVIRVKVLELKYHYSHSTLRSDKDIKARLIETNTKLLSENYANEEHWSIVSNQECWEIEPQPVFDIYQSLCDKLGCDE